MAKKKEVAAIGEGYEYEKTRVRGVDGKIRHSLSNGDAVAKAMTVLVAEAKDLRAALAKVARENKLGAKLNIDQYDNLGLFRMSLGNSLRGLVRNGTPVTIGDVTVKSLEQNVKVPEVKDVEAAPKKKAAAPKKAKHGRKPGRAAKSAASEEQAEAA
jgi:hypothetical protein